MPANAKPSRGGDFLLTEAFARNLACDIDGLLLYFPFQHHNWFTSGLQREEGQVLSLLNITRKDDGVYVCVADNGVHGGQAASARIALNVLCECAESAICHLFPTLVSLGQKKDKERRGLPDVFN